MQVVFYDKNQSRNFLEKSQEFREYFNNTNPKTFREKTGKNKKDISTYLNSVRDFTQEEIKKLTAIISDLPKTPLLSETWIFIKVSNRLEKGWPFTLENTIVVTSNFIARNSIPELRYTLCHEKIHNLQFKYPKFFTMIYKKYGFYSIRISNLNNIVIYSNPDGLQSVTQSFIYRYHNKWLLPVMSWDQGNITKKSFPIKISQKHESGILIYPKNTISYDTIDILSQIFPDSDTSQCYHPHEVFADIGAKFILGSKIRDGQINNFFLGLEKFIFDSVL